MYKDPVLSPAEEKFLQDLIDSAYEEEVKNQIRKIQFLASEMENVSDLQDFHHQIAFLKLELEKKYRKNQKPQILAGKLIAEKRISEEQIRFFNPAFQKAVLQYASMWQDED